MRQAGAAVLGLLALASPAQAESLTPAGDWQIEQAAESCRLWRAFGSPDQPTLFNIYAYGPDDSYRLVLTGHRIMRDRGQAVDALVRFGAEVEDRNLAAVASRSGEGGMLSLLMIGENPAYHFVRGWSPLGGWDWDRAVIPGAEEIESITVATGRMPEMTFEMGDMSGPLELLADCQQRLAASWGAAAPATPPVLQDAPDVLERLAMPEAMVVNHVSLIAQIRVMVDAQGRASDCVVQSPALESRQARGLCRPLLDLARFEPARDPAGNPVPALFRVVYSYHIFD